MINNNLLNNLNLELIFTITSANFLKNNYSTIFTNNSNINCTLRLEYFRKNNEEDYSVIKHENFYYFIIFRDFKIISHYHVELNENRIDFYNKLFQSNL